MSCQVGSETGGFRYIWKIENFSKCALEEGEFLNSPKFNVDDLEHTEWHLSLYPRGKSDSKFIDCHLNREKVDGGRKFIKIRFTLSVVTTNGIEQGITIGKSFCNGTCDDSDYFLDRKKVFENRAAFLCNDVLSVLCYIQTFHPESSSYSTVECTARSRICVERVQFTWNIKNFLSASEFSHTIPYATKAKKPPPIDFKLYLRDKDDKTMRVEKTKYKSRSMFVSCKLCLVDNTKKLHDLAEEEHFFGSQQIEWILDSSISKKLSNDNGIFIIDNSLSIRCDFWISVGVVMFEIEEVKILPPPVSEVAGGLNPLASDLRSMYVEQKHCDVSFRVGNSTTRAHKLILCARSPVFNAMFESDMKEAVDNSIDVDDLDFDTLDRLLTFLYSDSVEEDLGFESLLTLYEAADKYQVASLIEKCLGTLGPRISVENFCKVLAIGDMHQDDRLKGMVRDFMFGHHQDIMEWSAWRDLMESDFKLAADALHQVMSRTSKN